VKFFNVLRKLLEDFNVFDFSIKGNPVISWKAINAFPTKLSAPSFDAKSNDAAIETLDLQADLITMEET
jgi:phage tail-like protein